MDARMMPSLSVVVLTVIIGAVSSTIAYRILAHPLRSFPGPRIAAASSLYKNYYDGVLSGELINHLQTLHKHYGPVVRIAPNELHFSDPSAYSNIYFVGSPYLKHAPFYDSFATRDTTFGLLDPTHAKLRRDMMSPMFSRRAILKLESDIQRKVERLVNLLGKYRPDEPVDMFYALRSLTLDIITSYCFAMCPDTIEAKNFTHPLVMALQRRLSFRPLSVFFPSTLPLILSLPSWLLGSIFPSIGEVWSWRIAHTAKVDAVLNDPGLLDSSEHETVYHHLLTRDPRSRRPGVHAPSRHALIEEAEVLLGAGSDTVANACNVGLFHVLNNPRVYSKIRAELTAAWPDAGSQMSYESLEKLPYLTALIKESLRLGYGVVSPLPRVVNTSGAVIGGYDVPVGTVVSMGVSFLHNNPEIYVAPYTFDPERWLGDASKLEIFLVPFSRGPRMCLGINLAWCEMYLIFGIILRKLDVKLYETSAEDFARFRDMFVPAYEGRHMQVLVKEVS